MRDNDIMLWAVSSTRRNIDYKDKMFPMLVGSSIAKNTSDRGAYYPCTDEYEKEHQDFIFCTLTACDSQGNRVRTDNTTKAARSLFGSPHAGRCATNTMIVRNAEDIEPAEIEMNERIAKDPWGFIWYPGKGPWPEFPKCEEWFFADASNSPGHIKKYLEYKVPARGISAGVYYNDQVRRFDKAKRTSPKVLYVYSAYTKSTYSRDVSVFNLRAAREAFGDDLFVIFVELSQNGDYSSWLDYADVFLHANFTSSDMYYDSAGLQEGLLEAFRIFGKELAGIDLTIVLNDSLMGPMDREILQKLRAVQGAKVISVGVWANTVATGAGMAFTRLELEKPSFSQYWRYLRFPCGKWGSMAFYEGLLHTYFLGHGAECVTFTNDIMALNSASKWQTIRAPYYKHRNKLEGELSIFERWKQRVETLPNQTLASEDYYNMEPAEAAGLDLVPCALSHPSSAWHRTRRWLSGYYDVENGGRRLNVLKKITIKV